MISRFFIEHPRFAIVIALLFLLAGTIAIRLLPVTQYPNISPSLIQVTATYPGADAATVRDTVIQPIEAQLNGVKRMLYMSSTATDNGAAVINATFDIGSDGDSNTVNVQNRVNWATASLPTEVQQQGVIVKEKSSNMLLIVSLTSPKGTHDALFLSNFMSIYIKDEIARIPGVGDVSPFGERKYSMRLWLDPDRLASLAMTVDDVIASVKAQNVQVSAGAVGDAPMNGKVPLRLSVSTKGRLATPEEFGEIVIRAEKDGSQVKIKHVADVELGAENYATSATVNGKPGALLAVYQLNDANGLAIAEACRAKLESLKKTVFPEDLDYGIQYDTTAFISASIDEVVETLVIAVLLVILVTYIFLQDWRSTLVPTIAIPVSLVGTFAAMAVLGYSINLITLFGLILAIGIVVDDAIVVIENVNRLMEEEGLPPKEAAIRSMCQVTSPIIATTSVLLAMFLPICFMSGITGVMYRQFGITISISVFISMINALTLSPALSALLLKPAVKERKKFIFFRAFDRLFEKLTGGYLAIVRTLLRKAVLVGGLYLLFTCSLGWLYDRIPTGFVPEEDQGAFFVNIQLPDGASLDRTIEVGEKVRELLGGEKEVSDIFSIAGYNIITGVQASNCGFAVVMLKPWEERKDPGQDQFSLVRKAYAKLARIPEASVIPFGLPPIPGIGTTGGFSFVLQDRTGTDAQKLQSILNSIVAEANRSPKLSGVFSTFRANLPQLYLDIDREKVLKLGIPLADVNSALQSLFGYRYINDFNLFGKSFKVEVQAKPEYRKDASNIPGIHIRSTSGEMVPLGTFTEIRTRFVPQYLSNYNMYSSAVITGSPAPGVSSGEAMKEMERIAGKLLPTGMTFDWTDMSYQERLSSGQTAVIFALALVFIYLFLVSQYESWMIPVSVLLSVPVALAGALLSLLLLSITNNIYTQVGFVLLFGIACKTAILIVEFAKEKHEEGMPVLDAAEHAAKLRFRAVLMTAISFILGTWPLVIASGAGAVSRRSLGTAVFGGMLISVLFGTLLIPVFYAIVQKVINRTCGKLRS